MNPRNQRTPLAWGEYISTDPDQNIEIVGARLEFIKIVKGVVPRFLEQLRGRVYPRYVEAVEQGRRDLESGGKIASEPLLQLSSLVAWAEKFNAAGEEWILEGALRTLSLWQDDPELRDSLDIRGFRSYCAVDTLISEEEWLFKFEHPGWGPQFQRWTDFRKSAELEFEKQLQRYERQLRSLMESQGAVRARRQFSQANLEWFALYQLGCMSAVRILKGRPDLKGDESTILKGVKTAAVLLQWKNIRNAQEGRRNLEI